MANPEAHEVSYGRGGAGNIKPDSTKVEGEEVVRFGPEGGHENGVHSTGRGGAANIVDTDASAAAKGKQPEEETPVGSGHVPAQEENVSLPEETAVPEGDYHVGRGGAGNAHHAEHHDHHAHHHYLHRRSRSGHQAPVAPENPEEQHQHQQGGGEQGQEQEQAGVASSPPPKYQEPQQQQPQSQSPSQQGKAPPMGLADKLKEKLLGVLFRKKSHNGAA